MHWGWVPLLLAFSSQGLPNRSRAPELFASRAPDDGDNHNSIMSDNSPPTVLLIGSLGLDRLLSTRGYPLPDSKVRTVAYHEVGGGNAANTASAMGRLMNAGCWTKYPPRIKLLSRVGDDPVGKQLIRELEDSGVDTKFVETGAPGTTTPFTTVLVDLEQHTRTCIHTPGTCGELDPEDLDDCTLDSLLESVVHVHSDSRHTAAALKVVKKATDQGIPVSLDCEKDRNSPALDELLQLAGSVFTNAGALGEYLRRLEEDIGEDEGTPLEVVSVPKDLSDAATAALTKSMVPVAFFDRHYHRKKKEVIVTHGSIGALRIRAAGEKNTGDASPRDRSYAPSSLNTIDVTRTNAGTLSVRHRYTVDPEGSTETRHPIREASYTVQTMGVVPGVEVIDTTGAGDAFIGGYLMARLATKEDASFTLAFGAWVAARKIGGPGARSTLPRGRDDVNDSLGREIGDARGRLRELVGSFDTVAATPAPAAEARETKRPRTS